MVQLIGELYCCRSNGGEEGRDCRQIPEVCGRMLLSEANRRDTWSSRPLRQRFST